MTEVTRIDVHELRYKMQSTRPPLLVLAYEDDRKFPTYPIQGAIPFSAFRSRLGSLEKDRELVFYCG